MRRAFPVVYEYLMLVDQHPKTSALQWIRFSRIKKFHPQSTSCDAVASAFTAVPVASVPSLEQWFAIGDKINKIKSVWKSQAPVQSCLVHVLFFLLLFYSFYQLLMTRAERLRHSSEDTPRRIRTKSQPGNSEACHRHMHKACQSFVQG